MIKSKFKTEPDTAIDGRDALTKFQNKLERKNKLLCPNMACPAKFYGLIFMDLNMPVMDGFESTTQILEH